MYDMVYVSLIPAFLFKYSLYSFITTNAFEQIVNLKKSALPYSASICAYHQY